MKKLILTILSSFILLTGCSQNKEEINITTASPSGSLYSLGFSIANIWNKYANVKAVSQASNGGIENLYILKDNDSNISFGVTSIVNQAYSGEGIFKNAKNDKIRIIAGLYLNPNQIIVKNTEDINSLTDLKGKNFSTGAPGSTTELETKLHLSALGIGLNDLNISRISPRESANLIRENKLDGVWIMAGAPTASVTEMMISNKVKLLNVNDDVIDKLNEKSKWYKKYKIKKNTYSNQPKDINTSSEKMLLYTTSDLSEEIVYKLTKTFWENINELKERNKNLENISIKDATEYIGDIPLHKGSEKYYKEKGVLN